MDGRAIPEKTSFCRLPTPPNDFEPDRGWRPDWQQLNPSSEDKSAATGGRPVRVSVWDCALTSPAQMWSFRARRTLYLEAFCAAFNVLAATHRTGCRVVYDELDGPARDRSGAQGHAGIEGLDRRSGEPKPAWKQTLTQLAGSLAVRGFLDGGVIHSLHASSSDTPVMLVLDELDRQHGPVSNEVAESVAQDAAHHFALGDPPPTE